MATFVPQVYLFKNVLPFVWPGHACATAPLRRSKDNLREPVLPPPPPCGLRGENAARLAGLQGDFTHGPSHRACHISDEVCHGLAPITFLPQSPHDGTTSGHDHTRLFFFF